jgi:hypothetical protein
MIIIFIASFQLEITPCPSPFWVINSTALADKENKYE